MSQNILPEEPLFSSKPMETDDSFLTIETLEKKSEIERKHNLQQFSIKAFYITLAVLAVIVIADIIEQKLNIENELLTETFELVKYATTTILGFLFASNSK